MRWLMDTIGGLYQLFRLGVQTRFRLSGPYWRWRIETAFGVDPARRPPLGQRLHAMLDYARWVHRMRKRR